MHDKKLALLSNLRFYILVSAILLSVIIVAWLRLHISTDQLFYIRAQEICGLICLLYWYIALIISPLGYVVGKQRMKRFEFARRAIGVSAAYFALLHAGIAIWGQLGGISSFGLLPTLFVWSLIGGLIGILILVAMAATSFDKVISIMSYRKWKWLHRFVYGGFMVVVLHIWVIGTHVTYPFLQWTAFVLLITLSGLELFRLSKLFYQKHSDSDSRRGCIVLSISWLLSVAIIGSIPFIVPRYQLNTTHEHMDNDPHMNMEMKAHNE